jgi:hypothetical protein
MSSILRLFVGGQVLHQEQGDDDAMGKRILELLTQYRLEERPHMFEVEFPDAPIDERFMRFGTDPSSMRQPVPIDLEKFVDLEQKN